MPIAWQLKIKVFTFQPVVEEEVGDYPADRYAGDLYDAEHHALVRFQRGEERLGDVDAELERVDQRYGAREEVLQPLRPAVALLVRVGEHGGEQVEDYLQ